MSRPPTIPSRRPAASGFTLLEILVVVVLIGILTSLLVIGIGHLLASSKRQQTRLTLTQLQAMYADWQTVAHQPFTPYVMPAPGNVSTGERYGTAVWFTRDLMFQIRSTPANAAAFGKISPASLLNFPTGTAFPLPVTVYSAMNSYLPFQTTDYGRTYLQDGSNNKIFYDSLQPSGPAPLTAVMPPNKAYWMLAYPVVPVSGTPDNSVPVFLDAWGNPIIFVPGGSLGAAPNPANVVNGLAVAGSGAMVSGSGPAAIATQANSPDGHPFFASAGPDGDFSKGDDNLYSYEK